MNLNRYKQNLTIIDEQVYSYDTLVGEIIGDKLVCLNWTVKAGFSKSRTTTKHLNYVATSLGLRIISEDDHMYIENNRAANLYTGTNEGIILN